MKAVKFLVEKISDKHQEAFWYFDQTIAKCGNFVMTAEGDIQLTFPDGHSARGQKAVDYAKTKGYTDKKLANPKIEWNLNNWFSIAELIDGAVYDDAAIAHSYDEAIEMLQEMASKK
jgi:hypothetical protein